LHARHARDAVGVMPRATHERAPRDDGIASDSPTNRRKKFFWTTSRNRVVDDPLATRIARITRKRFAFASSRATVEKIAARENGCRSVRNTTVARMIRARERRFGFACALTPSARRNGSLR
jgi:hypothetical protein